MSKFLQGDAADFPVLRSGIVFQFDVHTVLEGCSRRDSKVFRPGHIDIMPGNGLFRPRRIRLCKGEFPASCTQ
ncbi:MAG: hypothetical protein D3914_13785 [Candidatus Electrothrix sp. LOE2]|nr:hypothetical protein [Candidatus Electrothrix sp. LOE2]